MGTLLTKVWGKREAKILICGLDAVGKTTILFQLKLGMDVVTIPTIGFNVETVDHNNVKFIAWDISGSSNTRALLRHYYQGTDAVIFVVGSDDIRMNESKEELFHLFTEDEIKDSIFAIVANKQDLINVSSVEEIKNVFEVDKIKQDHICEVFPISAKTGEGLHDVLDWIILQLDTKRNNNKTSRLPHQEDRDVSKLSYVFRATSCLKTWFWEY